jgi:hypothetical protein
MKWFLVFLFIGLVTAAPASAAVFPCSADSSEGALTCGGCENMGVIFITAYPTGAGITINPGMSNTYTDTSKLMLGDDPGTHTFTVSLPGYTDYTGQYQICTKKMTYATIQLSQAVANPKVSLNSNARISGINLQKITTVVTTVTPTGTSDSQTTTIPTAIPTTDSSGTYLGGTTEIHGPVYGANPTAATTSLPSAATTGTLSVTTSPAGAYVFIDGAQRGVSPATISGLPAGDHALLLKLEGYEDLTTSVMITAGETQPYSTGLVPEKAADIAGGADAVPTTAKSPGFELVAGVIAIACALIFRKR